MTTNTDELLACPFGHREVNINDKTMIEAHRIFWDAYHAAHKAAGRSIGGTDAGIRALLTHYALPQRPEGAAVACPRGHNWHDFGSLGGRNVSWCPRCDTLAWTGREPSSESPPASAVAEPDEPEKIDPIILAATRQFGASYGNPLHVRMALALEAARDAAAPQPAQAATVSDFLSAVGNIRVWQERHHLVNDCGAELALVLHSDYGGYVFRGEKFDTADEAKLAAEKYLASSPAAPAPVIPESAICHCTCHNDPLYCHSCNDCDCHKEKNHG